MAMKEDEVQSAPAAGQAAPASAASLAAVVEKISNDLGDYGDQLLWLQQLVSGQKQRVPLLVASGEVIERELDDEVQTVVVIRVTGPVMQLSTVRKSGDRFATFSKEGKALLIEQVIDESAGEDAGETEAETEEGITMANTSTNTTKNTTAGTGVTKADMEAMLGHFGGQINANISAVGGRIDKVIIDLGTLRDQVAQHGNSIAGLSQRVTSMGQTQINDELKIKEINEKVAKAAKLADEAMDKASSRADRPRNEGLFGSISSSFDEDPIGTLVGGALVGACASKLILGRWNPFADAEAS